MYDVNCIDCEYDNNLPENNKADDYDCLGSLCDNEGCFVKNNEKDDTKRRDDCLDASCNNEDNNSKSNNYNTSLPSTTTNSAKHNEVNNDNNIECNPSSNNKKVV